MERFNIVYKTQEEFGKAMDELITFITGKDPLAEDWSYMNNTNVYINEAKENYYIFEYKLCNSFSSTVFITKNPTNNINGEYCIALSHTNQERSELTEDEIVKTMEAFKQILVRLNINFE